MLGADWNPQQMIHHETKMIRKSHKDVSKLECDPADKQDSGSNTARNKQDVLSVLCLGKG